MQRILQSKSEPSKKFQIPIEIFYAGIVRMKNTRNGNLETNQVYYSTTKDILFSGIDIIQVNFEFTSS